MPFAIGDQVAVLSAMNPLPRVLGGPVTVTSIEPGNMYRLSNGRITGEQLLRPWTADTMVGAFIPGFNPQMAPGGQFVFGQQVALRFAPAMREIISGGPYLHNGGVVYETHNGQMMRRENELMVPGAVLPPLPAPMIAAAPANIYAGVPHEGERNVPAAAENAIFMNTIAPGTEMVDFHGEAGHTRYYTLDGFRQLPMKMFPGVGHFKENPHTRQPIRPGNVTRYRKTGGRRQRKGASRKNRRTRRR